MILKRSHCRIACMVVFALELAAQPQSWNNVKEIQQGTAIRVTGPRPAAIQGTLQSVTDDSLVLNASAGQETLTRQQITRVSVKKQGHRGRNALIGLGMGAGAGLGIGAASDHSCAKNGCLLGNNFGKLLLTPFGALVGALVGVVIPSGGWREIYKQ